MRSVALELIPRGPAIAICGRFDQLHSRGIMATREHAERAHIQTGMYVLEIGCGLGGASRGLSPAGVDRARSCIHGSPRKTLAAVRAGKDRRR